jgi:hypothetical protein
MSKPRIQYQRGKWYCSVRAMNMTASGVGPTPQEAYADWKRNTDPYSDGLSLHREKILEILRCAK